MSKEALPEDTLSREALKIAVQASLDGDWDKSHNIAQE